MFNLLVYLIKSNVSLRSVNVSRYLFAKYIVQTTVAELWVSRVMLNEGYGIYFSTKTTYNRSTTPLPRIKL